MVTAMCQFGGSRKVWLSAIAGSRPPATTDDQKALHVL